ncbi:MAG TPA: D-aminoacyl-tRNA deacylase [Polyangiaceae bacterium]|nr:D-aminoacyl-tRNA deacylase [Polyangiaceae bacterium]
MRAVVQRCREARVEVAGEIVGAIGPGLVAFVGAGKGDGDADLRYVADKLLGLRVFVDEAGKMNRSVVEAGGALLVVSQFTLYGDVRRGRRPGFDAALEPGAARAMLEQMVSVLRAGGVRVETGRFGADMRVVVDNDGPVTILVDSSRAFLGPPARPAGRPAARAAKASNWRPAPAEGRA